MRAFSSWCSLSSVLASSSEIGLAEEGIGVARRVNVEICMSRRAEDVSGSRSGVRRGRYGDPARLRSHAYVRQAVAPRRALLLFPDPEWLIWRSADPSLRSG